MAKYIGDICLQIQGIVNRQNIPEETCKKINALLCDIILAKNEELEHQRKEQQEKNNIIKIELVNLLKCYRGDEDAHMKAFSFDEYIEKIIILFDRLN